jgi:hypothetical protein
MIETRTGMRYQVLFLDRNARNMSMPVLRKLAELAKAGVTICGTKPEFLANYNADEAEFKSIVDDIWNSGRKNVSSGIPLAKILVDKGVTPDFDSGKNDKTDIRYVHRSLDSGEIYWVTNLTGKEQDITASFRVAGKKPVIWHAEDGSKEAASYDICGKRTEVSLRLIPHDAIFVLFLENAAKPKETVKAKKTDILKEIGKPWTVKFQAQRGAPESTTLKTLASLSESEVEGIRYFSGIATYSNSFTLNKKESRGKGKIMLDLGNVKDLAEVIVNGQSAGVCWHAPFVVDITSSVKKGRNEVTVKVVNMWHNRLVGDAQPDVKDKITYTQMPFFKADEPLLPSGLIGPVRILSVTD